MVIAMMINRMMRRVMRSLVRCFTWYEFVYMSYDISLVRFGLV